MLFKKVKDLLAPAFSLLLAVAYSGCWGYYAYFHVDISSYLSVGDLTLIFSKYCLLVMVILSFIVYLPYAFFTKEGGKSWWDYTIGKSRWKRRSLVIIPALTILMVLAVLYVPVRNVIGIIVLLSVGIFFLVTMLLAVYAAFEGKTHWTEVSFRDWIMLAGIALLLGFFLPFMAGAAAAPYMKGQRVCITFDDQHLPLKSDFSSEEYIGQTATDVFIYHPQTKTTTVYPMDKIRSIEYYPHTQ